MKFYGILNDALWIFYLGEKNKFLDDYLKMGKNEILRFFGSSIVNQKNWWNFWIFGVEIRNNLGNFREKLTKNLEKNWGNLEKNIGKFLIFWTTPWKSEIFNNFLKGDQIKIIQEKFKEISEFLDDALKTKII